MKFIDNIFKTAFDNGQTALTEAQCYAVFDRIGLTVPKWQKFDKTAENFDSIISSFGGDKVVLKILSSKIIHKTEAGGVKIVLKTDAKAAFEELMEKFPNAEGVLAVEFINYTPFALGSELMLGARADESFGPLVVLGFGGSGAEFLTKNLKKGVSPSIAAAADLQPASFIAENFAAKYSQGLVRGGKRHGDINKLTKWVSAFSSLINYFSDGAGNAWTIEEMEINPLAACGGEWFALDGVIRFRQSKNVTRSFPSSKAIESVVRPSTIGVIGVSENKVNMGRIILNNIAKAGMSKENTVVIKEGVTEIDGVKCAPSFKDMPFKLDTLVVTVPAAFVPGVIKEAAASGKVNAIVLISGAIGEKEGSADLKKEVEDIVIKGREINPDFALNGGNSLGVVSNPSKVNTLFIPFEKLDPPLGVNEKLAPCAFISQSGAFVISILSKHSGMKPVYCVTVGNQLDITVADYAAYAVEDKDVKVLLLYIEGFKPGDGAGLLRTIRRAKELKKKVVIYKAGRTGAGQKAVMGHTASIAGDYFITESLFNQEGALVASNFTDFEFLAQMCLANADSDTNNKSVFMISNAGFETSGMADNIGEGSNISVVYPNEKLSLEMKDILKQNKLDAIVDIRNPFDVTPMASDEVYFNLSKAALKSGQYGALVFSMLPLSPAVKTLKVENPDVISKLGALKRETNLPVAVVVSAGEKFDYYRSLALQEGLVVFKEADKAINILSQFFK
ncbi:Putative ADP acetyl-CoA synthetase [Elusimicrobium minutum Pei191]|uniref:Putative ADP acetyl-CoA synthetase n=1 Tax=Elusimicrobium minutum (strain Pei191) TaxID=445932 RepID=B2KD11_ELUMP|nr:acetate--CoA ligase family protein [Elusimicrobium minutum]ACC98407.1 Putative ADP acetyl-CoA synthetase [Elusimicrobium minutum Pei191]